MIHRQQPSTVDEVLTSLKKLAATPLEAATAPPKAIYTLPDITAHEMDRIFASEWLCAGRADELPNPGDYMAFECGAQPLIIIRGADGALSARSNICRHRMMRLVEGRGNTRKFSCPYHAWTYNLEGQLVGAAYMDRTTCFNKSDIQLPAVRCEEYLGWIYVCLDPDVEPVAHMLADLTEKLLPYNMQNYVTIFTEDHVWDTNWKCLTENFMEGYHLPVAHRDTVGGHFLVEETQFDERGSFPHFTSQLFVKTGTAPVGTAHPDNTSLTGKWRNISVMPTVFPCHMYVLAPDHLWYLALQPDGPGRTRIRYGAALAPEVLAAQSDPETYIAETKTFLDAVQLEDKNVVEGIFAGAKAPLSSPGPLSWLERENHEFTQYLARRLCD
ncbi:MAG: (2Fe-2S)-binding protein [SAR116 cluster bacterium]|nr:MAG: (2Fe-2S)-binding protein [SAR116 cluster bacterium]|tara:strand:- start:11 stop:1165 length:1155 start_codon:yes stop_codon:yes gene_type:complete